jgi:hypothetical protein
MKIDVHKEPTMTVPKALAMILLTAAAISAAGGLAGHFWPGTPQQIIVHFKW